jgi:hypothetical protein
MRYGCEHEKFADDTFDSKPFKCSVGFDGRSLAGSSVVKHSQRFGLFAVCGGSTHFGRIAHDPPELIVI